ncbi:unnamed protein product [Amoebophrya sp. A25]|nr:unnamed protein product [Amoebophrya sp. A25]|eukprot:GSA25T00020008001.1
MFVPPSSGPSAIHLHRSAGPAGAQKFVPRVAPTAILSLFASSVTPSTSSTSSKCLTKNSTAQRRSFANTADNEKLVLGLAISHGTTGFALVRFGNGAPKRFGLINHSTSANHGSGGGGGAGGGSKRSNSGASASPKNPKILTKNGIISTSTSIPSSTNHNIKNSCAYDEVRDSVCAALRRLREARYDFRCIGVEDTVKDRSLAAAKRDLDRYVETSKIQGVILTEVRRLWPDVPLLQIHPQRARDQLMFSSGGAGSARGCTIRQGSKTNAFASTKSGTGTSREQGKKNDGIIRGHDDEDEDAESSVLRKHQNNKNSSSYCRDVARDKLFSFATDKVSNFPAVKTASGKICTSSHFMSDAWATALYARLETSVLEKLDDEELCRKLRAQVLARRSVKLLEEQIRKLHPRRAAIDLEEVLESQVRQHIKTRLYQMVHEPVFRSSGGPGTTSSEAQEI